MVPLKLDRGQHLHFRSNALETVSTLQELFDLNGWPTGQLESPRYVFLRWEWAAKVGKGMWHDHLQYACADFRRNVQSFFEIYFSSHCHCHWCHCRSFSLHQTTSKNVSFRSSPGVSDFRPNGFALDAFLLLLGLASSYPHSILFLREADLPGESGAVDAPALPVTKQSLQRQWSRALTVTIGATMRTFPAALLLNSRIGSWRLEADGFCGSDLSDVEATRWRMLMDVGGCWRFHWVLMDAGTSSTMLKRNQSNPIRFKHNFDSNKNTPRHPPSNICSRETRYYTTWSSMENINTTF